jgi:hypothetical protein
MEMRFLMVVALRKLCVVSWINGLAPKPIRCVIPALDQLMGNRSLVRHGIDHIIGGALFVVEANASAPPGKLAYAFN